jgi:hypothetical protein
MSNKYRLLVIWFILISLFSVVSAQKKFNQNISHGKQIMWEPVDIRRRNLLLGPGGIEMRPDLSRVTYIQEKKGGASEKFYIRDGVGRTWVVKIGREAQPETAAVRLLWAIGYKTEINYLIPTLVVPGKGTYKNARLEARPNNIERGEHWNWRKNPFLNKIEFQGLKLMMAFFNNWDIKIEFNNSILQNTDSDETYYVVSDLGTTFGKLGSNSLPIFWRMGRSVNNPVHYNKTSFVKGTKGNTLKLAYKGQAGDLFRYITIEEGRWLLNLLKQLSAKQIADAFWAANYRESEVELLTDSVQNRIAELDRAVSFRTQNFKNKKGRSGN